MTYTYYNYYNDYDHNHYNFILIITMTMVKTYYNKCNFVIVMVISHSHCHSSEKLLLIIYHRTNYKIILFLKLQSILHGKRPGRLDLQRPYHVFVVQQIFDDDSNL